MVAKVVLNAADLVAFMAGVAIHACQRLRDYLLGLDFLGYRSQRGLEGLLLNTCQAVPRNALFRPRSQAPAFSLQILQGGCGAEFLFILQQMAIRAPHGYEYLLAAGEELWLNRESIGIVLGGDVGFGCVFGQIDHWTQRLRGDARAFHVDT